MKSMTGYGKAELITEDFDLIVEIKSVNHRFLDLSMKMPKTFVYLEDTVKKCIQSTIQRGHLDVYVTYRDKRGRGKLTINRELANQYLSVNRDVVENYSLIDDMTTTALMKCPDVLVVEEAEAVDLTCVMRDVVTEAVKNLDSMRSVEGEALKSDLRLKASNIISLVREVEERAPVVVEEYRVKLRDRIKTALDGVEPDESKLIQEVAFFCDKANVDEEITRLKAHMVAFDGILEEAPAGRKLDFLVQEINRECNTIGSKSNDVLLTDKVVKLKTEVEKIREQVQNVE